MAENCSTDEMLDFLMPRFKFREDMTDTMLKKITELPDKIQERIINKQLVVNQRFMEDLVMGSNPQRTKAYKDPRTDKMIEEKAMMYPEFYNESKMINRRKNEILGPEQMQAAVVGAAERWEVLHSMRKPLVKLIQQKDPKAMALAMKMLTEASALHYQMRGNMSEAARLLAYGRSINKQMEATGLTSLFGKGAC